MDEPENYRPNRSRRTQPEPERDTLIFRIAGGILLAFGIMFVGRYAVEEYREYELKQELKAFAEKMAAEMKASEAIAREREYAAEQARAMLPVPPGYRCVGKQLFRVLPNGFEQVTGIDTSRYCR